MIKGDFFPTPQDGEEANTGNKVTAQIQTLNIPSFSEAYWLGWVKPENVSSIYHLSKFTITDNSYVFTDVTKVKNYNIGYLSTYNDQNRSNNAILYPENPVTVMGSPDYARYINKLDVMSTGTKNVFQIDFRVAMYQGSSGTWRDMGFPINTMKDMLSYLAGESDVTITFANQSYYTVTKTFKLTDMTDGALEWADGTTQYVVTILGFHIGTMLRSITSGSTYGQYIAPTPCIDIETDEHRFISAPAIGPFTRTNFQTSFRWNDNTWLDDNYKSTTYQFGNYDYYCSGLSGEIPKTFTEERMRYGIFGNMLVFNDYNNYAFRITRIYTVDDIKHFMGIQIRIISVNSSPYTGDFYGYAEDDGINPIGVYAPLVTEDNEFTTDLITGNLSDDTFKNQLRDWQYDMDEWENNDYEEGQWPEPEEEAENIGDKITRPASIGIGGTNGFVTQYALDKFDVAQLGALLWTSFVDQDYWQNYLFSLAVDTGSFSLSSLLNFFVSLKVYPFSLVNIHSFDSWGNDMYIGTGVVPLHFTSPLHIINNYADYISGGTIEIPRYFNDYRDYINTEITLYLPFCGTVHLNPGDVIGNKITIQYAIDFATGGCIAYVDLETGDGAGYPIGAMPGQIGADIPLTATAAGEVAARFIGDAMNVGGLISGEVGGIAKGVAGAMGGAGAGGSSGGGSMFAGIAGMYGGIGAAMGADLAPGFARQGLQMLQRGAVSAPMLSGGRGFASFGAPSKPYVQIRRGIYPTVSGLATVDGKPAAGTYEIGQLTGFVQGSVKTDGLTCPENEKIKIKNLIASGIYV